MRSLLGSTTRKLILLGVLTTITGTGGAGLALGWFHGIPQWLGGLKESAGELWTHLMHLLAEQWAAAGGIIIAVVVVLALMFALTEN